MLFDHNEAQHALNLSSPHAFNLLLREIEFLGEEGPDITIDIEYIDNATADIFCQRLKRHKYLITINSGFAKLIDDIALMMIARVDFFGYANELPERPSLPPVSQQMIGKFVENSIETYLKRDKIWPSSSHSEEIRGNLELYIKGPLETVYYLRRKYMMLFALAHEVGHIVLGHLDPFGLLKTLKLFKKRQSTKEQEEVADLIAALFITKHLKYPSAWWSKFHINNLTRLDYDYNSEETLMYYKHDPFRRYDITTMIAFSSIAALFGTYDLVEKAANELGFELPRHYPPANERHGITRYYITKHLGIMEGYFYLNFAGQLGADWVNRGFLGITGPVAWTKEHKKSIEHAKWLHNIASTVTEFLRNVAVNFLLDRARGLSVWEARRNAIEIFRSEFPEMGDDWARKEASRAIITETKILLRECKAKNEDPIKVLHLLREDE
jgi:hypothetical protein